MLCLGLVLKEFIQHKIYSSYQKFIKVVCKATYKSLVKKKIIARTTKYFIKIEKDKIEYGLKNSSTYEQMIFLKSMKQAIDIDIDSRYIVEFYDNVCAVPEQFDTNKAEATLFYKQIKAPNKNLIYVKSDKGKRILLKYKLQSIK